MSEDAEMLPLRQPGGVPLHEGAAVFSGMLDGFSRQQVSRGLAKETIQMRRWQVWRFQRFADSYPWEWLPGDVEDFTTSLFSGPRPLSCSTVRVYHLTLRAFCDFITGQRYGWVAECRSRFGPVPTQVCFEWNTVAHTVDYEGTLGRRPLDVDELDALFAVADARMEMLRTFTFTRWVLLRRASRASSGDTAVGAVRHVKASLRGLVTFLAWIEEQPTPLRELTQEQVEEFINLRPHDDGSHGSLPGQPNVTSHATLKSRRFHARSPRSAHPRSISSTSSTPSPQITASRSMHVSHQC